MGSAGTSRLLARFPSAALPSARAHPRGSAARHPASVSDGWPVCRVLLNFEHQPANTPYRATHAVYVRKVADQAFAAIDTVPEVLASRFLAVRAFDAQHMMIDAEVCEGAQAAEMFERFLANPQTSYLQVHNARRGCYAARVERA